MKLSLYDYCMETGRIDVLEQWAAELNDGLTPRDVNRFSRTKVWWRCDKGHEWRSGVDSRCLSVHGCPVCTGRLVQPGVNDMASHYPEIAAQWHPQKNGQLTPDSVTPTSNRKVWWICDEGHEYEAQISHRTAHGTGCPYCAGRMVLAGYNDLATVNPELAKEWHPILNGELTPEMVTFGSKKKVWWIGPCGHEWQAAVFARAGTKKTGCLICADRERQKKAVRAIKEKAARKKDAPVCAVNRSPKRLERYMNIIEGPHEREMTHE